MSVEIPSGCVPFVLTSDKLRVETGDYPEQIIPIEKRPQWNAYIEVVDSVARSYEAIA